MIYSTTYLEGVLEEMFLKTCELVTEGTSVRTYTETHTRLKEKDK